jgi:hypothetical protein
MSIVEETRPRANDAPWRLEGGDIPTTRQRQNVRRQGRWPRDARQATTRLVSWRADTRSAFGQYLVVV